jgi:hypothetical protein
MYICGITAICRDQHPLCCVIATVASRDFAHWRKVSAPLTLTVPLLNVQRFPRNQFELHTSPMTLNDNSIPLSVARRQRDDHDNDALHMGPRKKPYVYFFCFLCR